jgi:hypothetical protein
MIRDDRSTRAALEARARSILTTLALLRRQDSPAATEAIRVASNMLEAIHWRLRSGAAPHPPGDDEPD